MHVIDSGLCRVSVFWLATCSYLRLCQKVSGPCYWALQLVARATSFVVAFVVLLDGDCRGHSLTPIVVTSSCSLEYITMDMFLYLTCSLIPHTLTDTLLIILHTWWRIRADYVEEGNRIRHPTVTLAVNRGYQYTYATQTPCGKQTKTQLRQLLPL